MDKQPWIRPRIVVFAFYALSILSTVQLSGAIYVLSTGIIDILCVWELTLWIISSFLSFVFLGFHLFLARRYQKPWFRRIWKNNLTRTCLIILSLTTISWLATFVLGLIIALRPRKKLLRRPNNSGWDKASDYKFQEASFAPPLLALVVAVFLCWVCRVTGRLFSESLQGTHDTLNDQEDQVQLSRKPSIGEVETYSHTPPEPFSQDPDDFFCWSPQCATPQTRAFPPTPSHFQTQMRPEPHEWSSSPQPYSAVSRNPTMREISSIYSHANSPSSSTHSRHANSMNSTRDIYRHTTMKKISSASTAPSAPKVSQLFRRNSLHGFQRGQKPSRPSSRPSMPPAAFWRYAAERRAGEASPVSLQCWQLESDGRKREPSMCRYPIITSRPVSAATAKKGYIIAITGR